MHLYLENSVVAVKGLICSFFLATGVQADADLHNQAALVSAELSIIAKHLSLRPQTAIDFSGVSNEFCYFTGWDMHHTHYAIDPENTREDNVDFVDARPLIAAGVAVDSLPALPDELGQMEPGQWYLVAEGGNEPHHGMMVQFPLLLRATDLQ